MNWSATDGAEVPPAVDTVTSTVPEPGGEVAEHEVSEVQLAVVPLVPKVAVAPPMTNPVPVIVTAVPPASGPLSGVTAVSVGPNRNWSATLVADVPAPVVALTSTVSEPVPVDRCTRGGGVTGDRVAAMAPKATAMLPGTNPLPVTETEVPPAAGPTLGLSPVTVGLVA